jgi:UDP-N-acetylmuramoylalanine--D-glutamate ligase
MGPRVSLPGLGLDPQWSELSVVVAGAGVTGRAVATALVRRGATVHVVDRALVPDSQARAEVQAWVALPDDDELGPLISAGLLVMSPGWRPDAPVVQAAHTWGVPVIGELDLAWTLQQQRGGPRPQWLALTGTNGKTTAVTMLEAMLRADGRRAVAAGNVGHPIVAAVDADEPYEVLALELSSFQLHRSTLMEPLASAVLNVAPDHLDWHGGFEAYAHDKGRIYERTKSACIYSIEDPLTRTLVENADVQEGCRAVGVTLGVPLLGDLGVVEDLLVDRAFGPDPRSQAVELARVDDIAPKATHAVANALTAAALARAAGVAASSVAAGLRDVVPQPHRIETVALVDGVRWVDDSKATNPHAAAASLATFDDIVWIAGGLAKGAEFDALVAGAASRLRAVVVLGTDRGLIVDAVRRHAPDVPVIDVDGVDTDPVRLMRAAVDAARHHASSGSTVLLAPACASMDRFTDYGQRGDLFADAVRAMA